MQSSCLKYEERRRVEGARMQSSCLEFEKKRRGNQDAEQLLRVRRREKKC